MRRLARIAVVLGTIGVVVGLSKVHAVVNGYDYTDSARFGWSVGLVMSFLAAAYGFGLPDVTRTRRGAWIASAGAAITGALVVSVVQLAVGDALLPRTVVFGSALVLVPWYVLCAHLADDVRHRASERDRVVLVGDLDDAETLQAELERSAERPALVVATLTPEHARPHDPPRRPLVDAVREAGGTVLVLDRAAQSDEEIVLQAAMLHAQGVRIRTLSLFYEQWLGKLPLSELERVSLLFDIGEVHAARYARLKRMLDVVAASIGLATLVVVTPIVLAGNVIANRGPLFYRQPRVGRGGTLFQIWKFRTMHPGAAGAEEPPGPEPTRKSDPRVTPFGGFLRRTHIDELPQVVNILRGELSIVGPRPEQPHLVERLSEKIPFYALRHLVRPGLTGWAQVKYHYGADDIDAMEKLQYEFFYLRRQSLGLDLRVMARTTRSIVGREGR
jgi:lipopolysaccharide/colanic/teichoic acid biosynthesis glycosyltransferase